MRRSGSTIKHIPLFFVTDATRADLFVKKQALQALKPNDGTSDASASVLELHSSVLSTIDQFVLVTASFPTAREYKSGNGKDSASVVSNRPFPL